MPPAAQFFLTMQAALVTPAEEAVIVVSGGFPLGNVKVVAPEVSDAAIGMVKVVGDSVPVTDERVIEILRAAPWVTGFRYAS